MSPPFSVVSSVPASLASEALADASEVERWFKAEILPHARALRAYLRMRFPEIVDPDDFVQETFLRVLKIRETGRVVPNKSYLFTVARNLALDHCRRTRVVKMEALGDVDELPVVDDVRDAAENACLDQEITLLAEAVRTLPERCRQVITLRKIYGLTHREIAARLGIAEKTAMAHINHGLARLREHLVAQGVTRMHRP
jgi:RNA polymerase sigma factor (sigma-70 family)